MDSHGTRGDGNTEWRFDFCNYRVCFRSRHQPIRRKGTVAISSAMYFKKPLAERWRSMMFFAWGKRGGGGGEVGGLVNRALFPLGGVQYYTRPTHRFCCPIA